MNVLNMIAGFYREKQKFIFLVILWLIAGAYFRPVSLFLVLGSIFLFKLQQDYEDMLFGFYIVLYLSDSYIDNLSFAHDSKPLYIFAMALFFFLSRKDFPEFNKFIYSFLPFCILALFLISRSDVASVCWQKTVSYILLLLLVPNFVSKLYRDHGSIFFRHLILMLAMLLFVALIYKYFGWYPVGGGRFQGFLGNPNAMGVFCTVFFGLYMVVRQYFQELFSRGENIFILLLIALSTYYADSRNAIFSIAIFVFFFRFYKISPFLGFIIFIAVLFSYGFLMANYHEIIEYFGLGTILREDSLESGSGRLVAWAFGWEEIQKNFFFGKGFAHEEFIYYFGDNQLKLNLLGHEGASHNSYLAMWLNTGLFGLVLFMSALVSKFIRASKNSFIAFPLLFSVLFSANFESWLVGSLNPYTILLLIALTIMTSDEFNLEERKAPVSLF